mgnify:CR=1 FL=1
MKIKTLGGRNVKGWAGGRLELGAVNVIAGRNFAGKTAILEAVKLALIGRNPRLGNRPSDTFRMSGGPTMTVEAQFEPTGSIIRRWQTKKGGAVEVISDGTEFEIPPVLLDLNEYLGLTGPQRSAFVFDRVPVEGLTEESVAAEIGKLGAGELAGNEHAQAAVRDLLDDWAGVAEAAREGGRTVQVAIGEFLDRLKGSLSDAKKEETRARAAVAQMVGAVAASGFGGIDPDAEAKLAAAHDDGRKAAEEVAKIEAARKVREDWAARIASAKSGLDRAIAAAPGAEKRRAEVLVEIETAEAKVKALQGVILEVEGTLAAFDRDAEGKAIGDAADAKGRLAAEERARERKTMELVNVQADWQAMKAKPCCPTCGTEGEAFASAIDSLFRAKVGVIEKEIAEIVVRRDEVARAYAVALKARDEVVEKANAHASETKRANALRAEVREAHAKLASLRGEEESLRRTVGAVEVARAVLAEAESHPVPPAHDAEALAAATLRASKARTSAEHWQGQVRALAAQRRDADRQQRATDDANRWQATVEVTAAAAKALKAIREREADKVLRGIAGKVARFTDGILEGTPVFHEGEFGIVRGSRVVAHDLLSGTEQLVVYAALAVALAAGSPFRLVIMDELGRLDPIRAAAVVDRMHDLVRSGEVDQFLGVDVDAGRYISNPDTTVLPIE